jgi:hypothetical protein
LLTVLFLPWSSDVASDRRSRLEGLRRDMDTRIRNYEMYRQLRAEEKLYRLELRLQEMANASEEKIEATRNNMAESYLEALCHLHVSAKGEKTPEVLRNRWSRLIVRKYWNRNGVLARPEDAEKARAMAQADGPPTGSLDDAHRALERESDCEQLNAMIADAKEGISRADAHCRQLTRLTGVFQVVGLLLIGLAQYCKEYGSSMTGEKAMEA